jgi:hypothetical protein
MLAALTLLGYSACATESTDETPSAGSHRGGTSGGSKAPASGGEDSAGVGGEVTDPGPGIDLGGAPSSMGGGDGAETCAASVSKAELLPLDLYFMIDASASMNQPTADGDTKWDAIRDALRAFIEDQDASDLGVGLQYFPIRNPDYVDECTSDEECGSAGPCALRWCWNFPDAIPCANDNDCGIFGPCVRVATCSESGISCHPAGATCSGNQGLCTPWNGPSICWRPESCSISDYTTPAIPIAPLSENASLLLASLESKEADGMLTTTAPALRGAINQARAFATENPDHTVVAVLATDGDANECAPTNIDSIAEFAALGLGGNPSIRTFVLGIFGPGEEQAFDNLNTIAQAGGQPAFLIDTSDDVVAQFHAALKQIRAAVLACEFKLPEPEEGETLDYGLVNVSFKNGDQSLRLKYVSKKGKCDEEGGWYYDVNPSAGIPTRIIACPASCESLQGSAENQVRIEFGCRTEVK